MEAAADSCGSNLNCRPKKLHQIAEFTELGEFLSYPVRTYSSGMFIRVAFAVSTSINTEILLLDEVMGPGISDSPKKRGGG